MTVIEDKHPLLNQLCNLSTDYICQLYICQLIIPPSVVDCFLYALDMSQQLVLDDQFVASLLNLDNPHPQLPRQHSPVPDFEDPVLKIHYSIYIPSVTNLSPKMGWHQTWYAVYIPSLSNLFPRVGLGWYRYWYRS